MSQVCDPGPIPGPDLASTIVAKFKFQIDLCLNGLSVGSQCRLIESSVWRFSKGIIPLYSSRLSCQADNLV